MPKQNSIINTPNGEVEILEKIKGYTVNGKKVKGRAIIKVLETGTVLNVQMGNLEAGKWKDYRKPSVYGVGYIGSDIKIPERGTYIRRAYDLWANMLKRAYGGYQDSYKGVTVDVRWHSFTNFLNTFIDIEGYDLWEKGEDVHLDKDLAGKNLYSLDTCVFIPASDNIKESSTRRWAKARDLSLM